MLVDERIWDLFKRHWRHTLTYWSVFFSFGLCIAFLGPTILDLKCQTHSTLPQITWVFFFQQFFLMLGSTLGGLFKKTQSFSLSALFVCTLIISLVFALIPVCHRVVTLAVAMAIAGTAMGVIDTTANQRLVRLYQKDSAVFLQVLHLFIGLGALVSPLVADPFLTEDGCVPGSNGSNRTTNTSSTNASSTSSFPLSPDLQLLRRTLAGKGAAHNMSDDPLHTEGAMTTEVSYAFWIMALINLPVPVAVCVLMYYERLLPGCKPTAHLLDRDSQSSRTPSETADADQGHGSAFGCCNHGSLRDRPPSFFIFHILGGAILFLTDGIIGSYAGFIYTYAVSPPLLMGHRAAGCLDSVFWASITAGRLACIYLSCRCAASRLLLLSLVGVVVVQCMLLILYSSTVFLFIGTCVLGLCISGVFPCMLAFTEDMLEYKGCATMVLVTSASAGEMLLQVIVGSVIHRQGSYSFLLCGFIAAVIACALFLLLLYVRRTHRDGQSDTSKDVPMTEKPRAPG